MFSVVFQTISKILPSFYENRHSCLVVLKIHAFFIRLSAFYYMNLLLYIAAYSDNLRSIESIYVKD